MKGWLVSTVVLWIVCPFTLWLTSYRPFTGSNDVARAFPDEIGDFRRDAVAEERNGVKITEQHALLLGTDDVIWRMYRGPDGGYVIVTLISHRENWKSIHPPDICLRGSNMVINSAEVLADVARLRLYSEAERREYVSLYRYGAAGLATGSYLEFFLFHAPRALFRASVGGYLIRVEAWVDASDIETAERRCRAFLDAAAVELDGLIK